MESAAYLALAYQSQRKFAESETLAREAFEFAARSSRTIGNDFAPKACWAPASLERRNTPRGSRYCWNAGAQGSNGRSGHYHLDLAQKWLVELYEAWGKPEKAAEWPAKPTARAGQLFQALSHRLPLDPPRVAHTFELFKSSRLLKGCLRVTPLKTKTSAPYPTG